MNSLFTWTFFNDALTRSVRTFAQTLLAVLGGGALDIWNVGWHSAFGVAAGSALLSLLMAVDRWGSTTVEQPVIIEPVEPVTLVSAKEEVNPGCGVSLR